MASLSPDQVASGAVDAAGLSVTVAPRQINDSRYGSVYDLANLAGAVPVHFHPINDSEYLMLFSRRWHSAIPADNNPGGYTSYTEDTMPGWIRIAVPTGTTTPVAEGYAIPTDYNLPELVDAVSRSNEYLFLLMSATVNGSTTGVIAHWLHHTTTGAIVRVAEEPVNTAFVQPVGMTDRAWAALSAEERVAQGDAVIFNRGLWYTTPFITVFGTTADNRMFAARKPWGRIGITTPTGQFTHSQGMVRETPEDPRWTYYTGDGWSVDFTEAKALTDTTGAVITSAGPVSIGTYADQSWLATVGVNNTQRYAQLYTQRSNRGWTPLSDTVPLGDTSNGSYLDTLRFQQQVPPLLTSAEMSNPANNAAVPYVISTKSVAEGVTTLVNTWGLWAVTRPVAVTPAQGTTPIGAGVLAVTSATLTDSEVTTPTP